MHRPVCVPRPAGFTPTPVRSRRKKVSTEEQATTAVDKFRALVRAAIPPRILAGVIYPLISLWHRLCRDRLNPALERIRLGAGVLRSKILLRSPGKAARAIGKIDAQWEERIADVLACPDNAHIPRVGDAGALRGSCVTMHNGLKIRALGYYGAGIMNLLIRNRGVHEPQEERAFQEVLARVKPGGVMIEAGAYWGFYSLWFASSVDRARCYLLEPDPRNIEAGRQNFALNGQRGNFFQLALGNRFSTQLLTAELTTLDAFCTAQGVDHVDILHADIQGAEMDMLRGAEGMLKGGRIDYVFLSTHSNVLHYGCADLLTGHSYEILCSADRDETYSLDGLLVARVRGCDGPSSLMISKKPQAHHASAGGLQNT